ncbi:MAG: flagellar basal body P-ring formation chaperone FlgA [Alphaproteobacteria bacterium]
MKIIYCLLSLLAATLASLVSISVVRAESIAVLKPVVTVASEIVTLGDLFHDAGLHSETAVFRAPDLGESGTVDTHTVTMAAARAGLSDVDVAGIQEVEVRREARMITSQDISAILQQEIARRLNIANWEDISMRFSDAIWSIPADALSIEPVSIVSLNLSSPLTSQNGLSRFEVLLSIDQGNRQQKHRLRGTALPMSEVTVLTRPIARGEVIRRGDLETLRVPQSRAQRMEPAFPVNLVGFEARRAMRPGVPISANDVQPPTLVARNDRVVIELRTGRLSISADGRAMEAGAEGDTISVINSHSKRVIDAKVIGRGRVELQLRKTTNLAILREDAQ